MTLREWIGRSLRVGGRRRERTGGADAMVPAPRSLLTERLGLLPVTPETLQADLRGAAALARVLGVHVPGDWPPELYDRDAVLFTLQGLRRVPDNPNWWMYYLVRRPSEQAPATVVGCAGYKGPPEAGTVEIGYSILRAHRERGYATEAARALVQAAFRQRDVRRVIAETMPTLGASMRVLEKCSFRRVPGASAPGIIRYELPRSRTRSTLPGVAL
ncbi:MAG: GNAT family N-acetyltransferase [Gemmatimonadota bacterium]